MTTEIIELKDIYRGFIALRLATLRLADGAARSWSTAMPAAVLAYDARRGAVMLVLARAVIHAQNGSERLAPRAGSQTKRD